MHLLLFYLNDSVGLTKKRYFSTTSMLCDRYSGFPPLYRKPTKCFKGACPCLSYDRSVFNKSSYSSVSLYSTVRTCFAVFSAFVWA